ncbi:MAG: DNA polymerase I [Alphaproteobacteria bacterium]|nr:MAG: DNA polymerase I [Alphaproteobacteria bacterium]
MKAGDHLFLVDGSSYIFRAYHALPPLTRKSDGLPVGAVAGFCNMLWKLLRDARNTDVGVAPTHFAVIFDYSARTFRHELYPDYKANREEPPADLRPQFGLIREATRAFGLPCVEMEGYEADDLIATYARLAREAGADVTIVASDKDLMQLVGDKVILYDQMKDKRIGVPEVIEKWGVPPEKMIDLQALTGDSTDNVPGVPGIGPKTAAQLLEEYGDLDTLLARAGEIRQEKRRQNILASADNVRLSRRLVSLKNDVELDTPPDALALKPTDGARLIAFLKALEFTSLTRRVAEATGTDAAQVEPARLAIDGDGPMRGPDLDAAAPEIPVPVADTSGRPAPRPARGGAIAAAPSPTAFAQARAEAAPAEPFDLAAYQCVRDAEALAVWVGAIIEAGLVAIDTETTSLDPMRAELVGISLCVAPGRACYVPVGHKTGPGDLLGGGLVGGQIAESRVLELLKPVLEDASVMKIGQNVKYDWLLFAERGIEMGPCDDTMLMSYVLEAGAGGHGMDELSERWLAHTPVTFKELTTAGRSKMLFDQVDLDQATRYAAEDADVTLRLWRVLRPRLVAAGLVHVYERLERPLITVLARMEQRGISIDRQILSRLSGELAQAAAGLEHQIYELAGERFNIGSPRQLGDILFGKMGLPGARKTKTGQWSTSVQVLDDLAAEGHELPRRIVGWRQLTKLKSTYTDALPGYINTRTGRVHTSYALASTSTGRLSSSEPNLQNIPVRTEEGRRIRTAFIAERGNRLISADYSQIELRVLAHIADIPQLRKAFEEGLDIHAMTASEMFNVPVEGMDPLVRRRAKAINFGIIYGISAFGLANQLSIPREEAAQYIKTYFERFPGIRDYMEEAKRFCRAHGYVETLFGRRAHYPDIAHSNPQVRSFNERAAINAPIQGSAADIIRRAMVRMDAALAEAGLGARMLLQVHDELVFEAAAAEVEAAVPVICTVMEEAPLPAVNLKVPLRVDARAAANWEEAH